MAETLARDLMSPEEARRAYDLRPARQWEFARRVDKDLALSGIARVSMPLSANDFERLTTSFDECIDELPTDLLLETYHVIDHRKDNSAGYVRKELKINQAGKQIEDPKSLIHFTESAR